MFHSKYPHRFLSVYPQSAPLFLFTHHIIVHLFCLINTTLILLWGKELSSLQLKGHCPHMALAPCLRTLHNRPHPCRMCMLLLTLFPILFHILDRILGPIQDHTQAHTIQRSGLNTLGHSILGHSTLGHTPTSTMFNTLGHTLGQAPECTALHQFKVFPVRRNKGTHAQI